MPDEPSERAKLIDVSDLPDGIASDPNWAKVREVSERGGFLDRSPAPRPTRTLTPTMRSRLALMTRTHSRGSISRKSAASPTMTVAANAKIPGNDTLR